MEKLVVVEKLARCKFCGHKSNDYIKFGPLYKLGNVTAHYFCVLLSNRLIQNGSDEEGILGFLLPDILKELKRSSNVYCTYCKKKNATIRCAFKSCRKNFHLFCGLQKGTSHQFYDRFKSFCHMHKLFQSIPYKILREAVKTGAICCICHESVDVKKKHEILWAPCCTKTWYHKFCLQKLAYSAGYFFKCAACNDSQKFKRCVQRFGIFVPQQDASWEMVPNAFSELLFRYSTCDAETCKCPYGRQKNDVNINWEIVLCGSCGSQGTHVTCGNLKHSDSQWECSSCEKVTKKMKLSEVVSSDSGKECAGSSMKSTELTHKKKRRGSEDLENFVLDKRKKSKINAAEEDEETEVDVETVEETKKDADKKESNVIDLEDGEIWKNMEPNIQDVLSLLKPGPLSYKLSLIRETCQKSANLFRAEGAVKTSIPVINLVDEEKSVDDDVEFIEIISKPPSRKNCHSVMAQQNGIADMTSTKEFSKTDVDASEIIKTKSNKPKSSESENETTVLNNGPKDNRQVHPKPSGLPFRSPDRDIKNVVFSSITWFLIMILGNLVEENKNGDT